MEKTNLAIGFSYVLLLATTILSLVVECKFFERVRGECGGPRGGGTRGSCLPCLEDDEFKDLEVLKEEDDQSLEGGLEEFENERVQGDRIHGSCDLAGLDLPQILPGDTNK